jgi:hypothetical protein
MDRLRAPDDNSERLQQRDEASEFALGRLDDKLRVTEPGDKRLRASGGSVRNIAGDDWMRGRHGGALESPNDNLLERVPLIMRIDGRQLTPGLGFDQLSFHVCPQHAKLTANPFHVADASTDSAVTYLRPNSFSTSASFNST